MRLIIVTCAWLALVDTNAGGGFRPRGDDCHLCFHPYKELGVPPHAELPQCKSAYLRPVNSRNLILTYYPAQAQIVGIPETVEVPLQDQPQHDVLPEPVLVKVESEETTVKDMMKNNVEPEEIHSAETASSRGGIEIEDDEEKPHRPVPEWSKTPNLTVALGKQLAQEINHDEVFKGVGRLKKKPSLGSFVISARLPRCSADWTCSPVPLGTCKSAWPATEEIAGENEENFDQMVPVTESATGSATGSTDGKHQKPFQLFQREESAKTAKGKQTDRPQQQQEVPSRCVTPEEVSDEAAIVQVEAIHGVFVKKGSCPFYLLKDRRYADPLETQWNAACELPDSAATAVNRFRVGHGKYKLRKWPCTLNEEGGLVRKACQVGVWKNEMDQLKKEACLCKKQRTHGKRH